MALDRMFASIENLRGTASAGATFGDPEEVEGRVLIPVASVSTGFGVGFGQSPIPDLAEGQEQETPSNAGGGAGGRAKARPVAVIEVSAEGTTIRPIVDETRVALAGIGMVAWVIFWIGATLRALFGRH
ncbi:MAG: hypothetical protein JXA09_05365 [Anaerolineae bacterium]|nr:hypothetical protein [Anaerolineae bacterium]